MTTENNGGMPLEKEPVITGNSNISSINNESVINQNKEVAPVITPSQNEQIKPEDKSKSALSSTIQEINKTQEEALKALPENWRDIMAAGDDKILKDLQKFKNPADYAKSKRELEILVSKTRPVPELPKDATPEQLKEWREKAGVPEKFEDYKIELQNGFVINDADKEVVNEFLKTSHKNNLTQSEVSKALQSYYEMKTDMEAKTMVNIEKQKQGLQKEWGNNFNANVSKTITFLESEGLMELDNAVLPDGSLALLNPKIINYFLKLAEKNNGSNTLTPQDGQTFTSIHARVAELEKMQKADEKAFWNNREARGELAQLKENLKTGKYKN
jgi:hypothetical protein